MCPNGIDGTTNIGNYSSSPWSNNGVCTSDSCINLQLLGSVIRI